MAQSVNPSPDDRQDAEEPIRQEARPAAGPRVGYYGLIVSCLFFALFYLHVWRNTNPNVLYYANNLGPYPARAIGITFPVFARGMDFFQGFLTRPGGLAEYAGAYGCQYYYYPLAAVVILTAVAWLVYLAGDRLIHAMGGTGSRSLRYIPPLLLLITYNRYTFHVEDYVALFAALAMAGVYVRHVGGRDKASRRVVVFAVMSAGLYYAAGGPYVLFAVLCGLFELLSRRRYVVGGLYLLAAAGVPLAGKYVFDIPLAAAYLRPSGLYPLDDGVKAAAIIGIYLLFVAVAVALPFRRGLSRLASSVTGRLGAYYRGGWLRIACPVLALAVACAASAFLTLDRDARTLLRANYYARMGMWRQVLEEARRYPADKHAVYLTHDINRALFETGQLGSKMFSYPQQTQTLIPMGMSSLSCPGSADALFRLGVVNQASLTGLEAIEWGGDRADALRLLAMIYVVKDQPDTARVFLNALRKDVLRGEWAENFLRRLDDDPRLQDDRQITYVRSVALVRDRIFDTEEGMFRGMLARNRKNRMAFEYLMAHYLLRRKLGGIVANIGRLSDFGHRTIPQHYAEALLLYGWLTGKRVNLRKLRIDQQTMDRFRQFHQIVSWSKGDIKARNKAFARTFPNSYFRYCLAGQSGGMQ